MRPTMKNYASVVPLLEMDVENLGPSSTRATSARWDLVRGHMDSPCLIWEVRIGSESRPVPFMGWCDSESNKHTGLQPPIIAFCLGQIYHPCQLPSSCGYICKRAKREAHAEPFGHVLGSECLKELPILA